MNVERRWLGTSVVRVRVLAAGLVLLAAGCAVLGWGSRSRQSAANTAALVSTTGEPATAVPSMVGTAEALPREAGGELKSRAGSLFAGLPLIFEPNQGQGNLDASDPRAKFVARGSGYSLFLGSEGAILSVVSQERPKRDGGKREASLTRVQSLQMKLAGGNPNASLSAGGSAAGQE